jgi:glutamyl-tRNA reductase
MTELVAIGLNFKGAPVELRERLAVDGADHGQLVEAMREHGMGEVMVVSTCNRVELYGVANDPAIGQRAFEALAQMRDVGADEVRSHMFVRKDSEAARHVFRVAASLESMVVGEPQILGQVKDAYTAAKERGGVGPVLDRCLTLAFKSAKRVRSETEIARGAANVSSVAVELAGSIFGDLSKTPVLVVGAGEMAEQAAVHLRAAGVPEIVVVNRSQERGQTLADKISGRYEPWERLERELARADVVVTSTGSKLPIIDRKMLKPVMKSRRLRPIFMVDIAVPRDVAADVAKMDHVFSYNVDDLQGIVHDNMRSRRGEADRAAALVDEEVSGFLMWMRSRTVGPLMGELQKHARAIVDAEVQRALQKLPDLDDKQRAVVEQLGRSVMQKLLHKPMVNVRKSTAEAGPGLDGPALADALRTLFELDAEADAAGRGEASPAQSPKTDPVPRPEPS